MFRNLKLKTYFLLPMYENVDIRIITSGSTDGREEESGNYSLKVECEPLIHGILASVEYYFV